jgi:ABC-type uncharacterized transport system substrate-binding protein
MRLIRDLAPIVFATFAFAPAAALAHPHVLVDGKEELVFVAGKLTAIRHVWEFDAAFTAFAIQGLDTNGDGKLSDAELAPLAKVNVESLSQFAYFSYLDVDGKPIDFVPPTEYWLEIHNARLTLYYTLPLKTPVAIGGNATLEVFDPEYFVAFNFPGGDSAITLDDAPAGCSSSLQPPQPLDAQTMAVIASIPVDQQVLPPELRQAAAALANVIAISCKGTPPLAASAQGDASATAAAELAAPPAGATGLAGSDVAKIAAGEKARLAAGTFGQ